MEGLGPFIGIFFLLGFPIIIFLSLVTVALFMWCWRRVWPYMKVTGKFLGSWRDIIPLFAVFLVVLLILLVGWYVTRGGILGTLFSLSLWVLVPIFIIFIVLVGTVWAIKFVTGFWPGYRRRFWMATSFVGSSTQKVELKVPARPKAAPPAPVAKAVTKEEPPPSVPWLTRFRQAADRRLAAVAARLQSVASWWKGKVQATRGSVLSGVALLRTHAFLLAFPFLLIIGAVFMTASLPFLPLLSLVMLPILAVSYLGKTTRRAAGGYMGDVDSLTSFSSFVVSSVEERWKSGIDFVLRLLRLR